MKLTKIIITILFVFAIKYSKAQYFTNVNGRAFQSKDFSDVKGTAYSTDDWATGTVRLNDNTVYNNMGLKYSEYDDAVYFKGKDDQMQGFAVPVTEFTLSYVKDKDAYTKHYKNGFTNITGYNADAYFEVLADGKAQLLKKTIKKIEQHTEYGSTTTDKSFSTRSSYYLVVDNKSTSVKKDKKSLLAAFPDKQEQLEAYIKAQNLNLKEDTDLSKLVTYYNSI